MIKDINVFRDPISGKKLILIKEYLYENDSGNSYPIINGIPRFVSPINYADNFGLQWNLFKCTQLDSYSNTKITFNRLKRCFNGHLDRINGKLILEAGSGAGRFTEILLQKGALVHSFDLSKAVEVNYENNNKYEGLVLAQGDIQKIPFEKNKYDYVVCLGVIQHTPNSEESIERLYEMVKPGGFLIFDHYLFKWRNVLPPPIGSANILYRKIILVMPTKLRFRIVKNIVDIFVTGSYLYDVVKFRTMFRFQVLRLELEFLILRRCYK
jgi:2-polyprenyl-3-methyl-5-hydroxy-6-metoxy-1,4-benzoquinol methylase